MFRHVSGLVGDAGKKLVDQRIAALGRGWSDGIVQDGATHVAQIVKELDDLGDVRLSDYLLGELASTAARALQDIQDIKRSRSWKIIAPLWRFETRRQRRVRRARLSAAPNA